MQDRPAVADVTRSNIANARVYAALDHAVLLLIGAMSDTNGVVELTEIGTPQWEGARQCLTWIQRLAQKPKRTRADALAVASELGCSRAHVYELLLRYQRDRRLTSLLPRRRGPERGRSLLSPEIDRLVHATIESCYLKRQRPRITELVTEVRRICHDRTLKPPSRKAISARLRLRPRKEIVACREGRKAARDRFAPVTGFRCRPGPVGGSTSTPAARVGKLCAGSLGATREGHPRGDSSPEGKNSNSLGRYSGRPARIGLVLWAF